MPDLMPQVRQALGERYHVKRELGAGGMAVVYLAEDLKLRRPVAIKVLRPDLAEALGRERFLQEVETVAKLQHPHLVPLFDSGSADGLLYFTMPVVEGETLRAHLRHSIQLPVGEALDITRQLAAAIHYAHGHGVIHRDIKPENIYLSGGDALLADFGIALAITAAGGARLTSRGITVGTPEYMSPEQWTASANVDGRSDVYSLACVLYEMLAGNPPFTGRSTDALRARHLQEPPPSLRVVRPMLSPALQRTIERALAKVPADRFPTATAFASALAAAATRPPWRSPRIALASGVVATMAMVYGLNAVAARHTRLPGGEGVDLSHVAVLYFDDPTPEGTLRWLARGLSEELIDVLGSIKGLTVTSRNGVRQYAGSAVPPDSIGRALDVGLLVDGTVEPAGPYRDSVRVAIRLVDASTGVRLDGLTLTRRLAEPLGLKRAVTEDVEQLLRRQIGAYVRVRQERAAAGSDALWEMVRRARELRDDALTLLDGGDTAWAVDRLRHADSLLALAERDAGEWVQPSIDRADLALSNAALWGGAPAVPAGIGRNVTDLLRAGTRHAERALDRAPNDARALAVHGELLLRAWSLGQTPEPDSMISAAHRDLMRATELDPSLARAWYALSEVLLVEGSDAQSRLAGRKALTADVYAERAPALLTQLIYSALRTGERSEADSLCSVGRRHYPDNPNFLECRMTILGWLGRGGDAVRAAWAEVARLDTVAAVAQVRLYRHLLVAAILARSGMPDSARRVLTATRALARDEGAWREAALYEAYVLALLGDRQRSVSLLRELVAEKPGIREWLAASPWFTSLHQDPEFLRLVRPGR